MLNNDSIMISAYAEYKFLNFIKNFRLCRSRLLMNNWMMLVTNFLYVRTGEVRVHRWNYIERKNSGENESAYYSNTQGCPTSGRCSQRQGNGQCSKDHRQCRH